MSLQERVLVIELAKLNFILKIYVVGKKKVESSKMSSDLHTYTLA